MLPSQKELSYFYQVAMTLNISHAARQLNTSQPSLSMAIKRLEEKLNAVLFHRQRKGLILTRQGRELLTHVKELIDKWEHIKLHLNASHNEVVGDVTISCNSSISPFMTKIMTSLFNNHPSLEIHLKHMFSEPTIKGVLDSSIDIGIVLNPPKHPELVLNNIKHSDIAFWSNNKKLTLKKLASTKTTILCDSSIPLIRALLNKLKVNNIAVDKISNINNFETITELALNDCGIAVLSSCYVEAFFPGKLHRVEGFPYIPTQMSLIYRQKDKDIVAVQTVADEIKDFSLRYSGDIL
jgi:LysR family transcriptional regulator, cell division regulator